ncbi:MAG: outer membrane protein assembly factor BamB family protein [Planctomycetota bacterium]|jgi:hypothetical protein
MRNAEDGIVCTNQRPPWILKPALAAALTVSVGCTGTAPPAGETGGPAASAPTVEPAAPNDPDEQYVVGLTASRHLGYRILWQTRTFPQADSGIKRFVIEGDSVFTLDGTNFLTRLRRENGKRLWRIPVSDPHAEIHGITFLPEIEQVFLTTGAHLLVLDADTGSQIGKQRLGQIAATAPVVFGPFFIYGARNGQLVWHSYEVGYQWRGYQVSSSIRIEPLLVGRYLLTIGADGRIMALDASSASERWEKRLLDAVAAAPVAGQGMVYVAGLDQYLRAFDMDTGREPWRYLTESPLQGSPLLVGDRLYLQIPTEGLVCFEARPIDAPGGQVRWTAPAVEGDPIGENRNQLMVWDDAQRRMTIVDVGLGAAITTVDLPAVRHLQLSAPQSGELYAAGDDGRVTRLVPR